MDDLFNFVLMNADHISGEQGLGFLDDGLDAQTIASVLGETKAPDGDPLDLPTLETLAPVPAAAVAAEPVVKAEPTLTAPLAVAPSTRAATRAAAAKRVRSNEDDESSAGDSHKGGTRPTKRLRRLEKNRASARECRRRKKEHLEVLEARVQQLEQEAAVLRERLRATKADASKEEVEEKQSVRAEMRERLAKGATDEDLAGLITSYRERFSDYGARRQTAVQYHLDQLERLLKPTQVTRMGMWCLHQDDEFYKENTLDADGGSTMWHFLCKELEVTPEQQVKIKQFRDDIRKLSGELRGTLDLLRDLRQRASVKNVALDKAMHDLQRILSPRQSAKFILWVDSNPVCMQMLNNLWSILPKA